MQPQYKYFLVGVAALVVVAFFAANLINNDMPDSPPSPLPVVLPPEPFSESIPENVSVLNAEEDAPNSDIGVPVSVSPSGSGVIRTFNVKVGNNVFNPNTLAANLGDTVRIRLTSLDKPYDLTIPLAEKSISVKKGETKLIEFKPEKAGKYVFYCDLCGGINSSTHGFIVILEPNQPEAQ